MNFSESKQLIIRLNVKCKQTVSNLGTYHNWHIHMQLKSQIASTFNQSQIHQKFNLLPSIILFSLSSSTVLSLTVTIFSPNKDLPNE